MLDERLQALRVASWLPPGVPNGSLVPAKPPSGYPPCEGRIRARRGYIVAIGLGLRDRLRDRLLGPLAGPDAIAPSSEPSNSTISTLTAPKLPDVPLRPMGHIKHNVFLQPRILIGNATGHAITLSRPSRSIKHNKINRATYDHALPAFSIN